MIVNITITGLHRTMLKNFTLIYLICGLLTMLQIDNMPTWQKKHLSKEVITELTLTTRFLFQGLILYLIIIGQFLNLLEEKLRWIRCLGWTRVQLQQTDTNLSFLIIFMLEQGSLITIKRKLLTCGILNITINILLYGKNIKKT